MQNRGKPSMLSVIRRNLDKEPDKTTKILPDGHTVQLSSNWNVWIHPCASDNWTLSGYYKIMTIKTISDFWEFTNNFKKLNYADYQFFIMRNDIAPTWEDPANKNGGASSLKFNMNDSNLLLQWEKICAMTICEHLYKGNALSVDVTGISFNMKSDTAVVKIWNNNNMIDTSKKIAMDVIGNKTRIIYIRNRPDT